jgi:hypothetical protein
MKPLRHALHSRCSDGRLTVLLTRSAGAFVPATPPGAAPAVSRPQHREPVGAAAFWDGRFAPARLGRGRGGGRGYRCMPQGRVAIIRTAVASRHEPRSLAQPVRVCQTGGRHAGVVPPDPAAGKPLLPAARVPVARRPRLGLSSRGRHVSIGRLCRRSLYLRRVVRPLCGGQAGRLYVGDVPRVSIPD